MTTKSDPKSVACCGCLLLIWSILVVVFLVLACIWLAGHL
jgi:hypothetical protein